MILNNRLSGEAEEEGLIADEQGGFRKQRGCRDHAGVVIGAIGTDENAEKITRNDDCTH